MQLQDFILKISEEKLFLPSDPLLLAVSGGVDSVVLCELCYRAGLSFEIAHVNFKLRGQESEDDEQFVRRLAEKYRVSLHVKQADASAYAQQNHLSVQVAARQLRYAWFDELMPSHGKYLLTAHHSDDNVETAVMNFFRGTGIAGLRGILPVSGKIIRPMLSFSKKEIMAFANENGLLWREDSSNASEKYSRNYFRNSILPLVYQVFPEADRNVLNNIERLREVEQLCQQALAIHKKKLIAVKGVDVHIPIQKLKQAEPLTTIIYDIIRQYHFTSAQAREVIRLLDADQGKYIESTTHRILKNRKWLIISPLSSPESDYFLIREAEPAIDFPVGSLSLKLISADKTAISSLASQAFLDARKIKYPLILRKWKPGDYFYPFGMNRKKKISRFLIDEKVSKVDKERAWVLESDKKICWLVGRRIDNRFRLTEHSDNMLLATLKTQ